MQQIEAIELDRRARLPSPRRLPQAPDQIGRSPAKRRITGVAIKTAKWRPFLNTYRTMCLAPKPEFRCVLEEFREMRVAA